MKISRIASELQVFLISASLRNEILEMTSKFMTGPFKDSCKFMAEEKLKEKGRNRKEKKRKKKKKREGRREPFHPAQRGRGASQPPCNSSSSLTDQH